MFALALAAAVPFIAITRADPITLEQQAIMGASDDGNTLALTCRPGRSEISVSFVPASYYGYSPARLGWEAQADSRFGMQPKPLVDGWTFMDNRLSFTGAHQNVWREVAATAEFIDALARDTEFNIRFEAIEGSVKTVTLHYTVDLAQLRGFLVQCGPKKVIARLQAMGSPAAP